MRNMGHTTDFHIRFTSADFLFNLGLGYDQLKIEVTIGQEEQFRWYNAGQKLGLCFHQGDKTENQAATNLSDKTRMRYCQPGGPQHLLRK